jgi:hypothetical protein
LPFGKGCGFMNGFSPPYKMDYNPAQNAAAAEALTAHVLNQTDPVQP